MTHMMNDQTQVEHFQDLRFDAMLKTHRFKDGTRKTLSLETFLTGMGEVHARFLIRVGAITYNRNNLKDAVEKYNEINGNEE